MASLQIGDDVNVVLPGLRVVAAKITNFKYFGDTRTVRVEFTETLEEANERVQNDYENYYGPGKPID